MTALPEHDDLHGGPHARNTDPWTSKKAANLYKTQRETHQLKLLRLHFMVGEAGLTSDEAGELVTGMRCPWKRISDLVQTGLVVRNGDTRKSSAGGDQLVGRISPEGRKVILKRITEGRDEPPWRDYRRSDVN